MNGFAAWIVPLMLIGSLLAVFGADRRDEAVPERIVGRPGDRIRPFSANPRYWQ